MNSIWIQSGLGFFHNGSKKSPQTNEEQIPLTAKAKGGIDKWVIWPQNEVN